jgi:hypothetical protein
MVIWLAYALPYETSTQTSEIKYFETRIQTIKALHHNTYLTSSMPVIPTKPSRAPPHSKSFPILFSYIFEVWLVSGCMIEPGCCPQEFIFISCGVVVFLHLGDADTVWTSISISKNKQLLGMHKERPRIVKSIFLKTKEADAIAAATSVPGNDMLTCMRGLFSVMDSGLSQHLWSDSGSPTFNNTKKETHNN